MSRLPLCRTQKKITYPSKTAAIGSAIRSSKRRGVPLRHYYHADCGGWHLTKQPRDEYLAKRSDNQHESGAA